MISTRIVAIRHGETAWNASTRIQGHTDIPLNDHGQRQARWLGQALSQADPMDAFTAVTCSGHWPRRKLWPGKRVPH
jgi:probable phosphoglycerate mutase